MKKLLGWTAGIVAGVLLAAGGLLPLPEEAGCYVELAAPPPPQATRDRDIAVASKAARIFFMFILLF